MLFRYIFLFFFFHLSNWTGWLVFLLRIFQEKKRLRETRKENQFPILTLTSNIQRVWSCQFHVGHVKPVCLWQNINTLSLENILNSEQVSLPHIKNLDNSNTSNVTKYKIWNSNIIWQEAFINHRTFNKIIL